MAYTINPHRHVKIWLSKHPDEFLPKANQKRLEAFRDLCPKDIITLVIDSSILSPKAMGQARAFCEQQNIRLFDIETELEPADENEIKLFELYKQEIKQIDAGGNLGQASDYLRWLEAIYAKGIYTDFDVHVNTNKLAQEVEIKRPLLLPLGSIPLTINTHSPDQPCELESVKINNDCIVIADDKDAAYPYIKKIQEQLIKNSHFKSETDNTFYEYCQWHITCHDKLQLADDIVHELEEDLASIAQLSKYAGIEPTAAGIRVEIQEALKSIEKQLNLTSEKPAFQKQVAKMRENIEAEIHALESSDNPLAKFRILQHKRQLSHKDAQLFFLNLMKDKSKQDFSYTVLTTTGPCAIERILFKAPIMSREDIDAFVAPFSLIQSGLSDAFQSSMRTPLHATVEQFTIAELSSLEQNSDLSWLSEDLQALDGEQLPSLTDKKASFFSESKEEAFEKTFKEKKATVEIKH